MNHVSHLCAGHPKGKQWVEGEARHCPHHVKLDTKSVSMRWGRKIRAKADREAGTVGKQQAGWIDG
jgi:hypothetical protein